MSETLPKTNCMRCHKCGTGVISVLDGEEWCPFCEQYQRPRSHGWPKLCASDQTSECPQFKPVSEDCIKGFWLGLFFAAYTAEWYGWRSGELAEARDAVRKWLREGTIVTDPLKHLQKDIATHSRKRD